MSSHSVVSLGSLRYDVLLPTFCSAPTKKRDNGVEWRQHSVRRQTRAVPAWPGHTMILLECWAGWCLLGDGGCRGVCRPAVCVQVNQSQALLLPWMRAWRQPKQQQRRLLHLIDRDYAIRLSKRSCVLPLLPTVCSAATQ